MTDKPEIDEEVPPGVFINEVHQGVKDVGAGDDFVFHNPPPCDQIRGNLKLHPGTIAKVAPNLDDDSDPKKNISSYPILQTTLLGTPGANKEFNEWSEKWQSTARAREASQTKMIEMLKVEKTQLQQSLESSGDSNRRVSTRLSEEKNKAKELLADLAIIRDFTKKIGEHIQAQSGVFPGNIDDFSTTTCLPLYLTGPQLKELLTQYWDLIAREQERLAKARLKRDVTKANENGDQFIPGSSSSARRVDDVHTTATKLRNHVKDMEAMGVISPSPKSFIGTIGSSMKVKV